MPEWLTATAHAAVDATSMLVDAVLRASAGWLALGIALHLANQVARGFAWHAIVRAAVPGPCRLRRLDTVGAWVSGAGAGGVLSARGGDAVRLLMLRRRVPQTGYSRLTGTLVAEGAGDMATGGLVVFAAVLAGLGSAAGRPGVAAAWLVGACLIAICVAAVAARRSERLRQVVQHLSEGAASLRRPAFYLRRVFPWQLASRGLRLTSVACLLAAFGLPVSSTAVLVVVAATSGGRLVPFAPAGVAASAAMLAAGFATATGAAVTAGQTTAYVVGTSSLLTAVGLCFASVLLVSACGGVGQAVAAFRGQAGKELEVLVSKDFKVLDAREQPARS